MSNGMIICVKSEVFECDFEKAVSVTDDGRVYYKDHVLLGYFEKGRFILDRSAFEFIEGKSFLALRIWIRRNWNFNRKKLSSMSLVLMDKIYYGKLHVATIENNAAVRVTERSSLFSAKQLSEIISAAN